jgi:hypothetical protein
LAPPVATSAALTVVGVARRAGAGDRQVARGLQRDLRVVVELLVLPADLEDVADLRELVVAVELGRHVGVDVDLDAGVLAAVHLGDEEVGLHIFAHEHRRGDDHVLEAHQRHDGHLALLEVVDGRALDRAAAGRGVLGRVGVRGAVGGVGVRVAGRQRAARGCERERERCDDEAAQ